MGCLPMTEHLLTGQPGRTFQKNVPPVIRLPPFNYTQGHVDVSFLSATISSCGCDRPKARLVQMLHPFCVNSAPDSGTAQEAQTVEKVRRLPVLLSDSHSCTGLRAELRTTVWSRRPNIERPLLSSALIDTRSPNLR